MQCALMLIVLSAWMRVLMNLPIFVVLGKLLQSGHPSNMTFQFTPY